MILNLTSFKRALRREADVAFSRHAQPVWFRVLKYLVLGVLIYFFWDAPYFWPVSLLGLVAGCALHFFYRYKTKGWTRSYGAWNYEKNKSRRP